MPAIGALLGMSERAARDWVRRHDLPVHGRRPMRVSEQAVLAQMAAEERAARKSPEVSPEVLGRPGEVSGSAEPIEAAYRVTPAEIEQAVSRTGVQYMADLRTMLAEVGKVYEGQLAAKDETIAAKDAALTAKDQALAADALTIAELRRRAEVAEEEVVRRRGAEAERLARVSALVREREATSGIRRSGSMLLKQLNQVSDEQEAREARGAAPPAPRAPTFWERVRTRLWGE